MEKNRLIYIFLLLLCLALILYSGHLISSRADLSQPLRSMLLKQGEEYLVKLEIVNTYPIERNYTISVLVDGKRYNDYILLGAGRTFTYKYHLYPPLNDKKVYVSVYREGELISENTYTIE